MELKTKLLLGLMKDNNYFKDLNSYLTEMVEEEKLTYENLKYLYNKLYKNKSLFLKQNIFPISQFLIKGYSTEEAEKLAKLLPDARGLTIFCYDEKEKGYVYNKLFLDLEFVYAKYDYYNNMENTRDMAYDLSKDEIKLTSVEQREIEVQIKDQEFYNRQKLESAYETIEKKMGTLREEFEKNTNIDKQLAEYFQNDNPKDRYKSIMVAGTILAGIELRNIWRDNGKLEGEKERFPYNKEQIETIHKHGRLQETIDILENYAEHIFQEEEEIE